VASRPVADSVRIDVDVAARRLQLVRGDRPVATYRVAVGTKEWPTETGEWAIKQVIINPEWIPPDQSWADENVPKKPGDPHNPLGRAQLVYDPPRTIHGTDKPSTIGKAASHGSIRMTNADVVRLATQVLALSGSGKDDAWVKNALAKRTEKQVVDLPTLVPIRVH
jgi:lipoprotein-anchoring transpeptidase ErfK/SrfK